MPTMDTIPLFNSKFPICVMPYGYCKRLRERLPYMYPCIFCFE